MRTDDAPAKHVEIHLRDYAPPAWIIDETRLEFTLNPTATRVQARIAFRRNPDGAAGERPDLRLDGQALTLIAAAIDGVDIRPHLHVTDDGLTLAAAHLPGDAFVWDCETEIDPKANTSLNGLYMSKGMYCTQCEAEGFRKITYYPDRPDVMTTFTVRIEGDSSTPVMLSNGEISAEGEAGEGRRWVEWHDPHPKPCYLFALVAGALVSVDDTFTTASGRAVKLQIFVRKGDEDKCAWAMDSLIRSMRWDEVAYGREYDLGLFMIVAVDDFNMGAMENKGLNIFNTKYVLASPETATDAAFEGVESVIAHEYFHNWTGNRITCRDWFQLCLKEGLTVFRDQQFSADERSAPMQRIKDVQRLRAAQFPEDDGPLAHPVRPESYIEINNFYTATVYEKGAEVIRMLRTLVGAEGYRAALDLYFDRHDGQACTIEDFAQCFEDATGRDLSQFRLWWSQAGTPRLTVTDSYDPETRRWSVTFAQITPPTPGQPTKQPLLIPVAFGALAPDGRPVALPIEGEEPEDAPDTRVFELTEATQTITFEGAPFHPRLSVLRGFSAPVILERAQTNEERAFLLAHDTDAFNRWEAGRLFARDTLLAMAADDGADGAAYVAALGGALGDAALDPAFRAHLLGLPSDTDLAIAMHQRGGAADPDAIHAAKERLRRQIGETLAAPLMAAYVENAPQGAFSPDAASAGRRALRGAALSALAATGSSEALSLAAQQFRAADNMTDSMGAMAVLVRAGAEAGEAALAAFYDRWKHEALVIDSWFSLQSAMPRADALDRVKALTQHPDFDMRNPNRFRSVIGAFAMNHWRFHAADGSGYAFFVDWLAQLDAVNPQTTARMAKAFESWKRYDDHRQAKARAQIERLLQTPKLSRDVYEILTRLTA